MAVASGVLGQIGEMVSRLSLNQKIIAGVIIVALLGGLGSLLFIGGDQSSGGYQVLFSGLTQQDAAEVVERLKEQRVPYQLTGNGGTIMVPPGQVYDVRLSLAGEGLPRGGGVGFEIFDKTSLGTTDFVQRLNYQRALQGELARTIRTFDQVDEARVHIATPKESVFIEDEKSPTASVSVRLHRGRKLSQNQIQSIVHLVASAVPGLVVEDITVVDTTGRLLFSKEGDEASLLSATQLEYQLKIEEGLRKKVESMLEEAVGVGHVRARVTAEMDFSRVNVTEESFDPESQVVRSEQVLREDDQSGDSQPEGIPGIKGSLANFAESGESKTGGSAYRRNNVTRNYEISRVTKQVQESSGEVKRLSVAVMIDGIYVKEVTEDGKLAKKYMPRSNDEMQSLERIVKNAIGYDEDRGDQVEVAGMSFALSKTPDVEIDPMEKWRELVERLAMPLIYLLIAIAFLLFVVRPFFRLLTIKQVEAQRAADAAERSAFDIVESDEDEEVALVPKTLSDQEKMFRLAQSDPARAADLVKRWLREEI
ncbi:MAG: flagellar basal-body MS-ring/collar protein FliF, partial [Desulfobulbaceae bacterium]|nr:flagellar basal-body MS-ring/collar protein FliF [Desulfobulbaceae bacterium]